MAERTVSIKITAFCTSVQDLIDTDKLDTVRLLDAVNSALGQLKSTGEADLSLKLKIKAGKEGEGDQVVLSEKIVSKFTGAASSPLRLALFNEELKKLEKSVGVIPLSEWPTFFDKWMGKFSTVTPPTP